MGYQRIWNLELVGGSHENSQQVKAKTRIKRDRKQKIHWIFTSVNLLREILTDL